MRKILAVVLVFLMSFVGCTDSWVKVALADLPVLVQMALNIATLTGTLSGQQISPSDVAAIQAISAEANRDLQLLDSLYLQYKANPSSGTLAQIENIIQTLQNNLPEALAGAHVSNPLLQARVSAAVSLILTTVEAFAGLLPHATPAAAARSFRVHKPSPKELKRAWNAQVYPQFK